MLHVKRKYQPPEQMPLEQANRLLSTGDLSGDELAWQPGMGEWASILSIPGVVYPTPPPLPQEAPPPFRRQPTASAAPTAPRQHTPQPQQTVFDPLALPPASQYRRLFAFFFDYGLLIYAVIAIEDSMGGSKSEYSTWVALGIGAAYLLLKDCLFRGASLGKLIFRLVVVDARDGHPCGITRSCSRNGVIVAAVAVASFLTWVLVLLFGPKVGGKAGGAATLLFAVYPFAGFGSTSRRTTCDTFAGTYVINAGTYFDALQSKTRNLYNEVCK